MNRVERRQKLEVVEVEEKGSRKAKLFTPLLVTFVCSDKYSVIKKCISVLKEF